MKIVRNYAIPYLIFLIIILLNTLYGSLIKNNEKPENFLSKPFAKNYIHHTYYSKSVMAIIRNENSLMNHPNMISLFSPNYIDDQVFNKNAQIYLVPPNEAITIYMTKDNHFWKYLFQYKNIQGVLDINEEKFAEHFSSSANTLEINQKAQTLLNEVSNHKNIHLDHCIHYQDLAFSEFTTEPLPQYRLDIISNRNLQFYKYKLTSNNIDKMIQVSGYEIRGSDKNKEQCFKLVTQNLKYYFQSRKLIY